MTAEESESSKTNEHLKDDEQTYSIQGVFYAEDFPDDMLPHLSPLREGEYLFELASQKDILDNLGVAFKGNINPDKLKQYLKSRIQKKQEAFKTLIEPFPLKTDYIIKTGNNQVHAYSYTDTNPTDLEQIGDTLTLITNKTPKSIYMPRNIVLLPDVGEKTYTGIPANGSSSTELATMFLYPQAFEKHKHRIPGIPNLSGTVAHEWAHQFISSGYNRVLEDWLKLGKWREVEWGQYKTDTPEECLNNYARSAPHEDFCESTAAVLLNPNSLDAISPKKFALLQNFLELQIQTSDNKMSPLISSSGALLPPEFPTHHRYTLRVR